MIIGLVTSGHHYGRVWARQFVRADVHNRRNVEINGVQPSSSDVQDAVRSAASSGGTLVFNVGHGGADGVSAGMFDFAPGLRWQQSLRRESTVDHSEGDMIGELIKLYFDIAYFCKLNSVRRVVLLSCNVGNNSDFVNQIADDWGTEVLAYTRRIAFWMVNNRARVYFADDRLGTGSNTARSETQLPPLNDPANYFLGRPGRTRRGRVPPPMP